jgi:hypothetical protein
VVLRAAHACNANLGTPLATHEVGAIIEEEITWWLRRNVKGRRYAR